MSTEKSEFDLEYDSEDEFCETENFMRNVNMVSRVDSRASQLQSGNPEEKFINYTPERWLNFFITKTTFIWFITK